MRKRLLSIIGCLICAVLLLQGCAGGRTEDRRPNIETSEHVWNGFRCVIPKGFVTLLENERGYMSAPASESESGGLDILGYDLVSAKSVSKWDDDPFSESHILTLLSVFDEDDSSDYKKHSVNTAANGINRYHLLNSSEGKYYCFAKVAENEQNALVLTGLASSEAGIAIYDEIVGKIGSEDIFCEPTASAQLDFERMDVGGACLYAINGIGYLEVDDADISRNKTDYELWGTAEDGTRVYRSKEREIVLLIEDARSTATVIAVRTDSDYWE